MQGKREGLLWVIIAILVAIIIKQRHGKTIKRWWQAYQHRHKQKRKWSLKPVVSKNPCNPKLREETARSSW